MGVHCGIDLGCSPRVTDTIDEDAQLDAERTLIEYNEYMLNELEKQTPSITVTKSAIDIESGEIWYDCLIKPAKPVERIQLNFVAEKTGISFDEIIAENYLD